MSSSAMTWSADENMKKLSICFPYRLTSNKATWLLQVLMRRNPVWLNEHRAASCLEG